MENARVTDAEIISATETIFRLFGRVGDLIKVQGIAREQSVTLFTLSALSGPSYAMLVRGSLAERENFFQGLKNEGLT